MKDKRLRIVKTFKNENEAMQAKILLEDSGIESRIRKEDGGGQIPHVTLGVDLLVEEDFLEKANDVLNCEISEEKLNADEEYVELQIYKYKRIIEGYEKFKVFIYIYLAFGVFLCIRFAGNIGAAMAGATVLILGTIMAFTQKEQYLKAKEEMKKYQKHKKRIERNSRK